MRIKIFETRTQTVFGGIFILLLQLVFSPFFDELDYRGYIMGAMTQKAAIILFLHQNSEVMNTISLYDF